MAYRDSKYKYSPPKEHELDPNDGIFPTENSLSSPLRRDVLGDVPVAVRVEDRLVGVALRERLGIRPAIRVVLGAAVGREMGRLRRARSQTS